MALAAAALASIGPLSLTLVGPALPAIALSYSVGEDAVAPAMTLYLAGFAGGQLVCGPLSDRYGRRPITLAFLGLYLLGTVLAVLAPTPGLLTTARLLQGLGASVGLTMGRAMVRDQFQGQAAARILSLVGMTVSVAPALAPVIGGAILATQSWRWLFVMMGVYSLALAAFALFRLRETAAGGDGPARRLSIGHILSTYGMLITSRAFLGPTLTSAFGIGGVYTFVTVAPFVLGHEVGLQPAIIGQVLALPAASYFLGAIVTNRLLARVDAGRMVTWGLGMLLVAGSAALALLSFWPPIVPTVIGPAMLWAFGMSMVMPGSSTGALAPFPQSAGAASALMGCIQMVTGTIGGLVATTLLGDVVLGLATVPLALALGALVSRRLDR